MSNCDCNGQPGFAESLKTRLREIGKELAALNSTKLGGKPNVKQQDGGTSVDHIGYKKSLYDEMAQIRETLRDLAENGNDIDNDSLSGGFEFYGDYGA